MAVDQAAAAGIRGQALDRVLTNGQRAARSTWFRLQPPGYRGGMDLSLLLIVIGIILALLVNYALGIVCILIGLVLLVLPRLRSSV